MSDFIRLSEHLVGGGFSYAYAVSAADLTGSGSNDLVVSDTNVGLFWFENDGAGNFTRRVIRRRTGEWIERHSIVDIDGDGKLEIVCVDNINACIVYFKCDGDPREESSWSDRYVTEGELPGAYDLTVADLDGDGDMDVAASSWRIGNHFAWFENRDGAWVHHMIEEGLSETRAIRAVDFDGDGRLDLLAGAAGSNQLLWYRNPGDPRVDPWERHVIDTPIGPFHGHPVDMDGDGNLDVVIALRGSETHGPEAGQIAWYENDGDPAGGPWRRHIIAEPFPFAFEAIAADVDGDGQMEVVATRWGDDGGLAIYKHDGDPRGPWRKQTIKDNWSNATQAIFADVDGDGRLDIVATSERGANEVRWWRNEGPAD